jgi:hypothetical protein
LLAAGCTGEVLGNGFYRYEALRSACHYI